MFDAIFHGEDLEAARARAREIGGVVIESAPPGGTVADAQRGYWSDDRAAMIRVWERVIE